MVDIEVIKQRLVQLSTSLNKVERFNNISLEEFLDDDIIQDVVEYNLFIAINMMIDIATHIVVDNNIGNPKTLGEAFDILNREKYLSDDDTKCYKSMVGLRNILSHEYVNIDKSIIYNIMKNKLVDIKKFIVFVNENFIWHIIFIIYSIIRWHPLDVIFILQISIDNYNKTLYIVYRVYIQYFILRVKRWIL